MPGLSFQPASATPATEKTEHYIDTPLFWREASGPHGERSPEALPLFEAVFAHDERQVASLLDRGNSANALLYPGGWSALMVAIAYNDRSVAQLLVRHGANINYISNDPATGTPLAVALSYGRFYPVGHPDFTILHYLLSSGADVNLEFQDSDIAIFAVTLGQLHVLNEFLDNGYHHNLPRLKSWLEIGVVDEKTQSEKVKALETVNRLLRR